jgi:hypothetical protein
MRTTYRVLAGLVAVAVVVQSMALAWAVAGLFHWVEDGGTLAKGWEDDMPDFQGAAGFAIHGLVGGMVLPALGLALLVVAFFAGVRKGPALAGGVLVLVVLQVAAGMGGEDAPWLGLVHGLLAFALFSAAIVAARAAGAREQTAVAATP